MNPKLPPLPTLVAFEAVARRCSFALAAGELHLTASAVSHQMARLESFLDTRLLDRGANGVGLTAAGEFYLQKVRDALGALSAATLDVKLGLRNSLYVHSSPSFASMWLMPRLGDFAAKFPNISLQMSASHVHSDFTSGQVDLDIRYGVPRWPNLTVEPIFDEQIVPLANPETCRSIHFKTASDLLAAPLIQSTVNVVQWADWFAAHKIAQSPDAFALRFDRAQLAMDAAVQGLGVALESTRLAQAHLEAGRLQAVCPLKMAVTVQGHFVAYPARSAAREEVQQFIAWMRGHARSAPSAKANAKPRKSGR